MSSERRCLRLTTTCPRDSHVTPINSHVEDTPGTPYHGTERRPFTISHGRPTRPPPCRRRPRPYPFTTPWGPWNPRSPWSPSSPKKASHNPLIPPKLEHIKILAQRSDWRPCIHACRRILYSPHEDPRDNDERTETRHKNAQPSHKDDSANGPAPPSRPHPLRNAFLNFYLGLAHDELARSMHLLSHAKIHAFDRAEAFFDDALAALPSPEAYVEYRWSQRTVVPRACSCRRSSRPRRLRRLRLAVGLGCTQSAEFLQRRRRRQLRQPPRYRGRRSPIPAGASSSTPTPPMPAHPPARLHPPPDIARTPRLPSQVRSHRFPHPGRLPPHADLSQPRSSTFTR